MAGQFVLEDFIKSFESGRSLDPLKKLKVGDLTKVAAHYSITLDPSLRKLGIIGVISEYCVEEDLVDVEDKDPSVEVMRLKLELQKNEREERRLAREEAEKAREAAAEAEQKAREAAAEEAKKVREAEREARLAEQAGRSSESTRGESHAMGFRAGSP